MARNMELGASRAHVEHSELALEGGQHLQGTVREFCGGRVTAAAVTHQLVHLNVFSVEFDAAHAVAHVCLPAHKVCSQIVPKNNIVTSRLKHDIFSAPKRALQPKHGSRAATLLHFHVAIVVSRHHNALLVIVRVAKRHAPTVPAEVLQKNTGWRERSAPGGGFVSRLEAGDGHISLPWVPCTRGYQMLQYCARQRADAAYAIYAKIK